MNKERFRPISDIEEDLISNSEVTKKMNKEYFRPISDIEEDLITNSEVTKKLLLEYIDEVSIKNNYIFPSQDDCCSSRYSYNKKDITKKFGHVSTEVFNEVFQKYTNYKYDTNVYFADREQSFIRPYYYYTVVVQNKGSSCIII